MKKQQPPGSHCARYVAPILVVIVLPISVALARRFGLFPLASSIGHHFGSAYGVLAQIFASMLGFVIAAITIVLGYANDERMSFLKLSRHYGALWQSFMSAIRWLAVASAISLVGFLVQVGDSPLMWIVYPVCGVSLMAVLRLTSCIKVLDGVVKLVTRPVEDRPSLVKGTILEDRV